MTAFRPPPDPDRCRAIVLYGGQRGRCRKKRWQDHDLCWPCYMHEAGGHKILRVPERAKGGK